ncbi:MAG: oligopeptide transporter, OPT family [Gemmatimonadetes bacterium]|nr:oligopeptide transporter, OPT family [Gemmatimonadota bacterium]
MATKRPTQQVRFTPRPATRVEDVDDGHQPFIPADESPVELTIGAVAVGVVLGVLFAASSVYLALKVSLTVSASIPIAVLSITIFKWVQNAWGTSGTQILRNNIVQTTGSAGESIAAGIAYTLPALLLLGYELPYWTVAAVGLVGGLLGVLLMIPLRPSLIVKEHRQLKFPEGTACAEVLIVGETAGTMARTVFSGFGLGVLYKFLNSGVHLWAEVPGKVFQRILPSGKPELFGQLSAEVSPELAGVGYIIGPRIAGSLFAGGVLSYFVLIPAIKLFGAGLAQPIFPGTVPIAEMDAAAVRSSYVFYIGAGAVTAAGLVSLLRALPTIVSSIRRGLAGFSGGDGTDEVPRTARDLPMPVVLGGVLACVVLMVVLPMIQINFAGALIALLFAFLFVTVSSRVAGQLGASANPISGMTVATVLLTALLFYAAGWSGPEHRALALSIGGVVCVAAAVAAATSQDLKTGYLVGATPRSQQVGLLAGVTTSALVIGGIIAFLNEAKTTIVERSYPGVRVAVIDGATRKGADGKDYRVGHLYEQTGNAPAGRYLVDQAGMIRYLVDPGIGGRERKGADGKEVDKLDSPKSQIMALVVDGILTQKLPWGLVLIGAFLAIAMEVMGVSSLPVAVGVYLPISTSATMFMGGLVRWLVNRRNKVDVEDDEEARRSADSGPGVLFSSGLIAGGAIMGVLLTALAVKGWDGAFNLAKSVGGFGESALVGIVAFGLFIALPLYRTGAGRK